MDRSGYRFDRGGLDTWGGVDGAEMVPDGRGTVLTTTRGEQWVGRRGFGKLFSFIRELMGQGNAESRGQESAVRIGGTQRRHGTQGHHQQREQRPRLKQRARAKSGAASGVQ